MRTEWHMSTISLAPSPHLSASVCHSCLHCSSGFWSFVKKRKLSPAKQGPHHLPWPPPPRRGHGPEQEEGAQANLADGWGVSSVALAAQLLKGLVR